MQEMILDILIININNLEYTRNLMSDLRDQKWYSLTIQDQGSTEPGTSEYLNTLDGADVIFNGYNMPLNHIWNRFYDTHDGDYLCFLNNDVRVKDNFVNDIDKIFCMEPGVGCVVHPTNHPDYLKTTELNYVIARPQFVQGWDFTFRREAFVKIPESLKFFGGDDWLFHHLYKDDWKVAVALSSPILHYKAKSRKYASVDVLNQDSHNLKEFGVPRRSYKNRYSKPYPTEEVCQMFMK